MKSIHSAARRSIAVFAACAILPLIAQNAATPIAPRAKAPVNEVVESQDSHAKVALLVGVGDYDSDTSGMPALKYPLSDIADVAKELKLQGYFIAMLKDRQATAAAVRQSLNDLAAVVEPNQGTMLFYFSGHGFRAGDDNFLATYGTSAADMAQQGLAVSEVQRLLAATGARQRIAFIDACRNNPGGKSANAGRPFETLNASEGLRVLYSTAPGKVSYEDDSLEHGVFSYYVTKGLRGEAAGSDGFITFNDLHLYLTKQMGEYSAKTLRVQMPYQLGESSGDFLLGKGVAPEVRRAVEPVVAASGAEKSAESGAASIPASDAGRQPQQAEADSEDADPPARVARLNYTDGDVSLQPAGVEEWSEAMVNRPITTGDKIFVDGDAHAELQIGNASIKLAKQAGFSFLNLTERTAQMQLTPGVLSLKVKRLGLGEVIEVDSPNSTVRIVRAGDYRFEVSPQGDSTSVSVREGQAEVTTASDTRMLGANESARLVGVETPVFEMAARQQAPDELDRWASARDRRQQSPIASRYVPEDMVGAEDLDQNGSWEAVQGQGMAWAPTTVSAGWAPYRDGQWAWVDPWGWTWVDAAPWGFAPFHYGRWTMVRNRWMWLPGGAGVRSVYSPAMVGWAGMPGPRGGLSVGVAWFPLGPREVYVPPYRVSRRYAGRVRSSIVVGGCCECAANHSLS